MLLHKHLLHVWEATHARWRETDTFVHQTFPVWTQAQQRTRPSIHPSLSTAILNHAIDSQLSFTPRVHRPYMGPSEERKEKADRVVEPWLNAAFEEIALLEPLLVWKQVGRHLLAYGYAVVEGPIYTDEVRPTKPLSGNADALRIWENERRMWLPFRIHAPNPARILLDPLEKRPAEGVKAVRRYNTHITQLVERRREAGLPVGAWDGKGEPYDMVDTYEYWSLDWHALVVDGTLLFAEENVWHQMPYKHAFAGYGQEPTQEDEQDPRYLAQGVLHPVLDALRAHAQHVSGRHNLFLEVAFNNIMVPGDAAEFREQRAEGNVVIEVPPGPEPRWMQIPSFPQWAIESEHLFLQDIEQGTYASSLAGIRQEGVSTVGQQAILSTAAQRKFEAPSKQLEHLATLVGQDLLRLVDMVGEPITVRGITLHPGDIDHDYSIVTTFELVDPVLQMRQKELGMAEVQMGLKSTETYWSADARLEDAAGERVRLLEDMIRKSPLVQELLAAEVMREQGLAQVLETMQQTGATPPNPQDMATPQGGGAMSGAMAQIGEGGPSVSPISQTAGLTPQVANPQQAFNAFTGSMQGGVPPRTPGS